MNRDQFENENVHQFYEKNSSHFSSTRYAPWPGIKRFLDEYLTNETVVLDSGCGNGRNLRPHVIGFDYCRNLLIESQSMKSRESRVIAHKKQGRETCSPSDNDLFQGSILEHPFKDQSFDLILSISVIHHLSSRERRIAALKDLHRICKQNSRVLIYVWSRHISNQKKCKKLTEEGDFFVKWNNIDNRYYFLYTQESLRKDCVEAGFTIEKMEIENESIKGILFKV